MKKIISLILSVTMVFSVVGVAFSSQAFAQDKVVPSVAEEKIAAQSLIDVVSDVNLDGFKIPSSWDEFLNMLLKFVYNLADKIIDSIVSSINKSIPSVDFPDKDTYVNDAFYDGLSEYITEPAQGAVWSVGYASESLQTGDELDGKHYVGGSLSFPKSKAATDIYDDQRVRTIAIDDGSGRGKLIFAVIDGFGMSNTDVRGIRKELADFAKENDIAGINISVLHQHSCVDTFGMNGDLLKMVFVNPFFNMTNEKFNTNFELINGQNKSFMENLYKVTVKSVKDAVNSMTEGRIFYSEIDAADYIRDKREPMVYDTDIHRFRFVPFDSSVKETWICNAAIHCVGNGAASKKITGDYPYYMEQVINQDANANFILIQGAELAITSEYKTIDIPENLDRIDRIPYYGNALGKLVVNSTATETEVAPLFNYKMAEYYVPVKNQILAFAGKLGALTNTVVSLDDANCNLEVATEIGYLEIGTDIAVAIIPGELEPAIAYGGCLDASNSWSGTDFDYPSLQEIVGNEKNLLVFGIMNDQIGYILEDNDYSSILSGVNEEIVATGNVAGSETITAFKKLVSEIER